MKRMKRRDFIKASLGVITGVSILPKTTEGLTVKQIQHIRNELEKSENHSDYLIMKELKCFKCGYVIVNKWQAVYLGEQRECPLCGSRYFMGKALTNINN